MSTLWLIYRFKLITILYLDSRRYLGPVFIICHKTHRDQDVPVYYPTYSGNDSHDELDRHYYYSTAQCFTASHEASWAKATTNSHVLFTNKLYARLLYSNSTLLMMAHAIIMGCTVCHGIINSHFLNWCFFLPPSHRCMFETKRDDNNVTIVSQACQYRQFPLTSLIPGYFRPFDSVASPCRHTWSALYRRWKASPAYQTVWSSRQVISMQQPVIHLEPLLDQSC
jgi:hypothetical protein